MRAPGHPQGCFLTEILMDELADRVRIDPVEFRIKNAAAGCAEREVDDLPAGRRAKLFGWDKRHPTGDADTRPDQNRFRLLRPSVGRRRPRLAGALRNHGRMAAS